MVIKLFSAWFCPYAQRAWLTLAHHEIPFEYIESLTVNKDQSDGIHGYTKNPRLLEINPKGLVPTLELQSALVENLDETTKKMLTKVDGVWVMKESIDCMIFLNAFATEKRHSHKNLIPNASLPFVSDANNFNQSICSTFYKILMKPSREEQKEAFVLFANSIAEFIQQVQLEGFYHSKTPTIVDFTLAPWLLRIPLLQHYRPMFKLDECMKGDDFRKLEEYMIRIRSLEAVQKTLWKDENDLIAVYKRYADGSATSQVGQAVISGKNAHDV